MFQLERNRVLIYTSTVDVELLEVVAIPGDTGKSPGGGVFLLGDAQMLRKALSTGLCCRTLRFASQHNMTGLALILEVWGCTHA